MSPDLSSWRNAAERQVYNVMNVTKLTYTGLRTQSENPKKIEINYCGGIDHTVTLHVKLTIVINLSI